VLVEIHVTSFGPVSFLQLALIGVASRAPPRPPALKTTFWPCCIRPLADAPGQPVSPSSGPATPGTWGDRQTSREGVAGAPQRPALLPSWSGSRHGVTAAPGRTVRKGRGVGPVDPAPRAIVRCRYASGLAGQMNVLQLAKNVRELSLIISVAE
jgi:hypothetical protein